jgi:creatinine amidohydrolase
MTMQWELMTSPQLGRAARELGVCVLSLGVLERHSDHLPLGTDYINAHRIAVLAAEREPAVAFPPFYFGQIYEARCFPGAVTLRPTLLFELLQGVLDEIGRNGFKKIVLSNGHGGNNYLNGFLVQAALWESKPYTLYLHQGQRTPEAARRRAEILAPEIGGHAGASETSTTLYNAPEGVHLEDRPDEASGRLGRLDHLPGAYTAVSWYANYPEHYAGDARRGSAEIGRQLVELDVEALAAFIAAVKADQVAPALQAEFFARERTLRE